jgi:predicted nucleic acid-binding protein
LFSSWHERDERRVISAVNLTDVLVAPAQDRPRLRRAREAIAALGVSIHRPGDAVAVDAARFRAAHPISLPDAYCLATAARMGASLASFDEKVVRAATAEGIPTTSGAGR